MISYDDTNPDTLIIGDIVSYKNDTKNYYIKHKIYYRGPQIGIIICIIKIDDTIYWVVNFHKEYINFGLSDGNNYIRIFTDTRDLTKLDNNGFYPSNIDFFEYFIGNPKLKNKIRSDIMECFIILRHKNNASFKHVESSSYSNESNCISFEPSFSGINKVYKPEDYDFDKDIYFGIVKRDIITRISYCSGNVFVSCEIKNKIYFKQTKSETPYLMHEINPEEKSIDTDEIIVYEYNTNTFSEVSYISKFWINLKDCIPIRELNIFNIEGSIDKYISNDKNILTNITYNIYKSSCKSSIEYYISDKSKLKPYIKPTIKIAPFSTNSIIMKYLKDPYNKIDNTFSDIDETTKSIHVKSDILDYTNNRVGDIYLVEKIRYRYRSPTWENSSNYNWEERPIGSSCDYSVENIIKTIVDKHWVVVVGIVKINGKNVPLYSKYTGIKFDDFNTKIFVGSKSYYNYPLSKNERLAFHSNKQKLNISDIIYNKTKKLRFTFKEPKCIDIYDIEQFKKDSNQHKICRETHIKKESLCSNKIQITNIWGENIIRYCMNPCWKFNKGCSKCYEVIEPTSKCNVNQCIGPYNRSIEEYIKNQKIKKVTKHETSLYISMIDSSHSFTCN